MSDKQRYVCVLSDNGDLGVRSERLSKQENADDKPALRDIAHGCILEALDPPEGPRAPVPLANGPFFLPNNHTEPFLLEAPRQAPILCLCARTVSVGIVSGMQRQKSTIRSGIMSI